MGSCILLRHVVVLAREMWMDWFTTICIPDISLKKSNDCHDLKVNQLSKTNYKIYSTNNALCTSLFLRYMRVG